MNFHTRRLFILFISICLCGIAQAENNSSKKKESVSQSEWLSQFEGFFTTGLCEKKEYVTNCLGSSVSECKLSVRENLKTCASSTRLPAQVSIGRESEIWGAKIGRCLSPKLVGPPQSKNKTQDPKCAQLSNW